MLSTIGISCDTDGLLEVDTEKLKTVLKEGMVEVESARAELTGLVTTLCFQSR
jgi:flagellar capping protein FliD